MPIAPKGDAERQPSMARWVGAVQASKPAPVKGAWAVTAFGPATAEAGSAGAPWAPGAAASSVRARASSSRTASGASPYERVAITPDRRRAYRTSWLSPSASGMPPAPSTRRVGMSARAGAPSSGSRCRVSARLRTARPMHSPWVPACPRYRVGRSSRRQASGFRSRSTTRHCPGTVSRSPWYATIRPSSAAQGWTGISRAAPSKPLSRVRMGAMIQMVTRLRPP